MLAICLALNALISPWSTKEVLYAVKPYFSHMSGTNGVDGFSRDRA